MRQRRNKTLMSTSNYNTERSCEEVHYVMLVWVVARKLQGPVSNEKIKQTKKRCCIGLVVYWRHF